MNRRAFLTTTLGASLATAQTRRKPNILFVTADDLGLLLGCYGEKRIQTPNLDKFATTGVRFEVAYVAQASCSPSRSAMFTGLFPHSNGQYGLTNGGFSLHPGLVNRTIPNMLKEMAGYKTGILGKLHVNPEKDFAFDMRKVQVGMNRHVRDNASHAAEFFKETGDQPFFLMVNFGDPHAFRKQGAPNEWYFPPQVEGLPEKPVDPTKETLFRFQGIDTPEQRERTANYLNACARFDYGFGLLLDELRKAGKEQDTLIVVIGDHGPPFARGKTTTYEAGLCVPFIVRWPGFSKAGLVSKAMVSTVDIAPTFFDAAGVQSPSPMHGQSLRPVVSDGNAKWREFLAAEFHTHGAKPRFPRRAIRDTRYKLIHNLVASSAKPSTGIDGDTAYQSSKNAPTRDVFETFANPPEFELYDLQNDPDEFRNLAGKTEAAKAEQRLKTALLDWRKQTQDPFLDPEFLKKWMA